MNPTNRINRISNIQHESNSSGSYVRLTNETSKSSLDQLLKILKEMKSEFTFYDEQYPSPSDPGAFFSYSRERAQEDSWSMTLGNHGWTGGIYQIRNEVLCLQLMDLISCSAIDVIQLNNVHFFSHYMPMGEEDNVNTNDILVTIHGEVDKKCT